MGYSHRGIDFFSNSRAATVDSQSAFGRSTNPMANSTIQLHPPSETKTVWAWLVGTFFGAGLLKPGPGTYGSIAAVLLWYGAAQALNPTPIALAVGTTVAAVLVTAIGIPAATIVARESGLEDPGHVVIDDVAAQLIALLVAQVVRLLG